MFIDTHSVRYDMNISSDTCPQYEYRICKTSHKYLSYVTLITLQLFIASLAWKKSFHLLSLYCAATSP